MSSLSCVQEPPDFLVAVTSMHNFDSEKKKFPGFAMVY